MVYVFCSSGDVFRIVPGLNYANYLYINGLTNRLLRLVLHLLGEDGDQVAPPEGSCRSLDNIMVVAAAPALGAFTSAFESGVEDRLGECAHRLPYGAVLFRVDEVAYAVPHLAFAFLYKKGFAHAHQRRSSLGRDGSNVASNEGVIGGGGNDGSHIAWCLRV